MKGTRLFSMVCDLSTGEYKKLLTICSKESDKRYRMLSEFLTPKPNSKTLFNKKMEMLYAALCKSKNEREADKSLRRFIDFAETEIENLKLADFIANHPTYRSFFLAQIYHKSRNEEVFFHYAHKSLENSEKAQEHHLQSICLDLLHHYKGRTQGKKEMKDMREMAIEKERLLNYTYHKEASSLFFLHTNFYLDDTNYFDDLKSVSLFREDPEKLANESLNNEYAFEYLLSKARMSFYTKTDFFKNIKYAEQFKNGRILTPFESDFSSRRLHFLKLIGGFHYGKDAAELLPIATEINNTNQKYEVRDTISYFYYLLLLLLNNRDMEYLQIRKEWDSHLIMKDKLFFIQFTEGVRKIKNQQWSFALDDFTQLSYNPNFYISAWAKLFEILIHFKQNNYQLAANLTDRNLHYLMKNSNRAYTHPSSIALIKHYKKILKSPNIIKPVPTHISPVHRFMLDTISLK